MRRIFHIAPSRSGHHFVDDNISTWLGGMEVVDLENIHPKNWKMWSFTEQAAIDDVFILTNRDFLNWSASWAKSYLKMGQLTWSDKNIKDIDFILDAWYETEMEMLGVSNHLPNFVKIRYDEFVSSQLYRKDVCDKVNGLYNESKLNYVKVGSSFDVLGYQNRGTEMDVLNRHTYWKSREMKLFEYMKRHPAYQLYMNNK